ncbi:MAG: outer membrane beta-barrel protein [Gemmatimonadota bacterium]|nr:outer membrane beta-barrel protein [Gemmatimonadota bacterium]
MLSVFFAAQVLAGAGAGDVEAQHRPVYFVTAGFAAPASSSVSDVWYPGIGLGAGAEYFFHPSLAVQGHINYVRFGFDQGKFKAENDALGVVTDTKGGEKHLFSAFAGLKYTKSIDSDDLDVRAVPYAVGGVGILSYSEADTEVVEIGNQVFHVDGQSGAGFAINAGAGIDIRLTDRVHLFVEARFEAGFTSGERGSTQLFPARVGLSFE